MSRLRTGSFVVLMLLLTGLFVMLGTWQVQRLGEKEALVARIAERATQMPEQYSSVSATDDRAGDWNYRNLTLTGRFVPEETVLVLTSLASPNGTASGPGYWVMTPFSLNGDGTVWVNRGFVPEARRADFAVGQGVDEREQTITGIARDPERPSSFTPPQNTEERIDYVRDPLRLGAMADQGLQGFAPFTMDLPAGPAGTLPQGGETVIEFPNNHMGYAITWYGFALLTPIMLVVWVRRQRRPATTALAGGPPID